MSFIYSCNYYDYCKLKGVECLKCLTLLVITVFTSLCTCKLEWMEYKIQFFSCSYSLYFIVMMNAMVIYCTHALIISYILSKLLTLTWTCVFPFYLLVVVIIKSVYFIYSALIFFIIYNTRTHMKMTEYDAQFL